MKAGRGPVASPLLSTEERWLRDAESALFWFRAVYGSLGDDHDLYADEDWYQKFAYMVPSDGRGIDIVNQMVILTKVPQVGPLRDKVTNLRELREYHHRRGYTMSKGDFIPVLEALIERAYEMKEAEEWTSDQKP